MGRYLELTKPRITCFILMSTAVGFVCGMNAGAPWTWITLMHTLLGTALIASGTAALNQWYEREADAKMSRTMARPIPSGRVTGLHALIFGLILAVAGFPHTRRYRTIDCRGCGSQALGQPQAPVGP